MLAKTMILSIYAIAGILAMTPMVVASELREDHLSEEIIEAASREEAEADRIQQTRPPRG
ncbi:hypothetical protein B9T07_01200 [Limnospira fusiformis CCALA 023]|uniref:hypothetical protein n=1 Tax=Arthrospira sp. PCC 8006 TaxID=1982224 RepID=UPI00396E3116